MQLAGEAGERAMHRKLLGSVVAMAATVLVACGGGAGAQGGQKPIVIGVSVSLSGDFSGDGKALEQGYQLWADDVNAAGGLLGRKVEFKFVDDDSSTQQVVTNYQDLITADHVDLTFGPFSSLLTIPASTVAARYGYAFPEPAGGGPQVFSRGLRNLFFVQPAPVEDNLVSYVHWLLSLPAGERPATAAYATQDDPFTKPQLDKARQLLEAAGIRTVYSTVYPAETSDYTPLALAVAQSHADVVLLGTQLPDAVAFVQTFIQQHYNPRSIVETTGPDQGAQFSDKVGLANTEGIMVPSGWWSSARTYQNAHFVKEFIAKYGGNPGSISADAAEAYSVGQVVAEAVSRIHSIDNAKLIQALHAGTFDTVQGKMSFDSAGRPQGQGTFLVQWQHGQTVPVYPTAIAIARPEYPKPAWS
jgi:branched-chain amino acid transport system substrate-binding protein